MGRRESQLITNQPFNEMNIQQQLLIERQMRRPWHVRRMVQRVHEYLLRQGDQQDCPNYQAAEELLDLVEALFEERCESAHVHCTLGLS